MRKRAKDFTVKEVNAMYGCSRQAYYKRKSCQELVEIEKKEILEFVLEKRKRQPMVGGKKLYKEGQNLKRIKVGRDRFYDILREAGLLIKRKRWSVKTTNSRHKLETYKNLIKEIKIERPGQVIVSDITYIYTREGFCYLSLLTDYYSRMILGYAVSESLTIEGSMRALEMALAGVNDTAEFIHHSDRGIQYCSNGYTERIKKAGGRISMTEENHVYENAMAERVNGILKNELGLGSVLPSIEVARSMIKEAVKIYNEERLHMSIEYKTPAEKYREGLSLVN